MGAVLLAATLIAATSWFVRGLVADKDMAEFKEELRQAQDDQREQTAAVEEADTKNTQESTARVDTQEQKRAEDIRYVDREVIKYQIKYRDRACELPADWLRLYNQSLGIPGTVPETK